MNSSQFNIDLWNEPSPFQNSQAYEQKNHNWDVLRNYGTYVGNYIQGIVDGWEVRFSAQLNQTKQPDEVVDARVDVWGKVYPNLHAHLVNMEESAVSVEDNNISDDSLDDQTPLILKVRDLTTSSSPLKCSVQGTVAFTLPNGALETTTTSQLQVAYD